MDIEDAKVLDGLLYVKLDGIVYKTVLRSWRVQSFIGEFITGEMIFQIVAIAQAPPATVEIEGPK